MALKTAAEYIESLRNLNTKVYMFGGLVENWVDHPIIRPSINSIAMTYELASDPAYEDLLTATSGLTGNKISRFSHLHRSTDDLVKKVKMLRLLGQKTASGFQRSAGLDAFNAVFSTTFECDQVHGTRYHENFKNYLTYIQDSDLAVDGAINDPKGDSSKSPSQQSDPDLYLRIVERREDGIIVRGAKAHQTGSVNSHEYLILPTAALAEEDRVYAVSFACPSDAAGLFVIYGRQASDTRKFERDADVDLGNKNFGGQEALVVFDNVFIPNDRIFLCGEADFAGVLAERFSGYQHQSSGGSKAGLGDVVIGAAALAADYSGAANAPHIKDKLIEMTYLNETLYSCGIACSAEGHPTASGNYQADLLLANVCKQNVASLPYEIIRLAVDIAGGLITTIPSQADLRSGIKVPTDSDMTIGEWANKFFKGVDGVSTENRIRILRFLENISLGSAAAGYRAESTQGVGSLQAQQISIARQSNLAAKKELAKAIAGIKG